MSPAKPSNLRKISIVRLLMKCARGCRVNFTFFSITAHLIPNLVRRKERTSPTGPAPTMSTGRCGASPRRPPPAREEKCGCWRRRSHQIAPRCAAKRCPRPPPAIDGIDAVGWASGVGGGWIGYLATCKRGLEGGHDCKVGWLIRHP